MSSCPLFVVVTLTTLYRTTWLKVLAINVTVLNILINAAPEMVAVDTASASTVIPALLDTFLLLSF